jgi:sulfur carrier protein ThiS
MQITVRLFAGLSQYRPASAPPAGAFPWETADGATPAQVAAELGIPPHRARVCAVNGQTVPPAHLLQPGDHLAFVAAAAGGASASGTASAAGSAKPRRRRGARRRAGGG